MIYTSGIVTSLTEPQTLEQLQDNKLTVVCEKLNLQPTDHLLDIGCGWGTLAAFAHKNYGSEVTGITLGKNQTKFGNERISSNGGDPERARILCLDYRDIPGGPGHYTKIVSLEMAEVRSHRCAAFLVSLQSRSMLAFVAMLLSSTKCTICSMIMGSSSFKWPVYDLHGNMRI
jgi:cyclopropane fatty-acyl-phospholipid synthase-like methyltransferase